MHADGDALHDDGVEADEPVGGGGYADVPADAVRGKHSMWGATKDVVVVGWKRRLLPTCGAWPWPSDAFAAPPAVGGACCCSICFAMMMLMSR